MAYVYRHIRLDKNEPFYIGIGKTINRAYSHRDRNIYWERIVSHTDFNVEIIFDDLSWDEACEKEIEFIKLYGRKDLGTGTLANMTDGGEGVLNHVRTEEQKIKHSLGQRGNQNWKKRKYKKPEEVHFNKGRVRSEDFKQKIRDYNNKYGHPCLGKKMSQKTKDKISATKNKKPVLQYTLDGLFVKEYESTKAVRRDGYNQSNVWKCCHNKSKTHKNFIWKFKNQ